MFTFRRFNFEMFPQTVLLFKDLCFIMMHLINMYKYFIPIKNEKKLQIKKKFVFFFYIAEAVYPPKEVFPRSTGLSSTLCTV
jgi:hypothetical protein